MARASLPTLCAVLVAVVGVSLGLVPKTLPEEPNPALVGEDGHGQEKGPTLRLTPVDFTDEGADGPQQDVLGGSPYYALWEPSDGTAAAARPRLVTHLPVGLLSILRGKRGEKGRRGREVRVYDRATRRWYRYFIPSLSMNNVFGQFRPAGTIRRTRGDGAYDHQATGGALPETDYGRGSDTQREGGSRAWPKDAERETDYGYY